MPGKKYSALLQFRCTEEMKEQVELAAAQCELTPGDWQRAITQGALEVHFASLAESEADETSVPEAATDPDDYLEKLEQDARVLRQQEPPVVTDLVVHPGLHDEPVAAASRINPRDCPHPRTRHMGGRCTMCGARLGTVTPALAGSVQPQRRRFI